MDCGITDFYSYNVNGLVSTAAEVDGFSTSRIKAPTRWVEAAFLGVSKSEKGTEKSMAT